MRKELLEWALRLAVLAWLAVFCAYLVPRMWWGVRHPIGDDFRNTPPPGVSFNDMRQMDEVRSLEFYRYVDAGGRLTIMVRRRETP